MEAIVCNYFKRNLNLNLFHIPTFARFKDNTNTQPSSKLFLNAGRFYFRDVVKCFFYSIILKSSSIMCSVVGRHITNKKNHFYYLKNIKLILRYMLHYETNNNFLGIRFKVHGKFQGKLRKRIFKVYDKYISFHRIKSYVDFSFHTVYTRFGVFSVRI